MVTITQSGDLVTLINVFTCEPANQQALIDASLRATEETLGQLPRIISAALHKSKDGTRVVNYAQWKTSGELAESGRDRQVLLLAEMGKIAKPDAHLYEVCYQLDKTADE